MSNLDHIKSIWAQSIVDQDLNKFLSLYDVNAIVKPTSLNQFIVGQHQISQYFGGIAPHEGMGFITNKVMNVSFLECFNTDTTSSGKYSFELMDGRIIHASYTFVYIFISHELKIMVHHSSKISDN